MRASRGVSAGAVLACALLTPTAATAAQKPTATTGGVANIAPSSAVVNATVNPRDRETTYFFRYGTTRVYGAQTPVKSAGAGTAGRRVAEALGGLAPATTYHYRIVARNSLGVTRGADRTFKTARQPLGVSLAATPNPLFPGSPTTLGGVLSGTNNANRQVVLQSNPYPYTQGFANAADPHVTDANGAYSFPILSVPVNTQYRVLMPANTSVVSPIVVAQAAVRVGVHTRTNRGRRSGVIRFAGFVRPAVDGSAVLVQKLRGGAWVTIAQTYARSLRGNRSRYVKRVRQRRGGRYRIVADVTGAYSPGGSRTVYRRVRD
jgi:hypothetical protein